MSLRFYFIKLLSFLSLATCLSLSAAEIPNELAAKRSEALRVMCDQGGYTPELLLPRLSFCLALLCNRDNKEGRIIAENAVGGTIALSRDGHYCAFILQSDRNSVQVYDTHKGKLLPALRGHTNKVTCLAFSPDGQLLFSGGKNGDVHVWNFVSGALIRKHTCPLPDDAMPRRRPVHCFSDDCCSCLIGGYRDSKCWDFNSGMIISAQDLGYDDAAIKCFAASGQLVLTRYLGGLLALFVYDMVNRREILPFDDGGMSYACAGNLVAVCRYDFSHVEIWDTQTGNLLKTLPLKNKYQTCKLCFGPDGNYLVVSVCLRGYVFDVKTGRLVQELNIGPVDYLRINKCFMAVNLYGQIAAFCCDNYGIASKVHLFNSLPQVRQELHSLSLDQLLILMEIVPSLARRGHIIHLTPDSPAWNLVDQMPREIRALVEPCLGPVSWSEYLRSWVSWR